MRRFSLALSLIVLVCMAESSPAANRNWIDSRGGLFQDPGNWAGGVVPGIADTPVFNLDWFSYDVAFNAPVTNDSLLLRSDVVEFDLAGNSWHLANSGTASLLLGAAAPGDASEFSFANGTFTSAGGARIADIPSTVGALSVRSGASVSFNGLVDVGVGTASQGALYVRNGGQFTCAGLDVGAANTSFGNVTVGSTGAGAGTLIVPGTLRLNNGQLSVQFGGVAQVGSLSATQGTINLASRFDCIGNMSLGSGVQLWAGNGTVTTNGVGLSGTARIAGQAARWFNSGSLVVNGTLLIGEFGDAGGVMTNAGSVTIGFGSTDTGYVRVQSGGFSGTNLSTATLTIASLGQGTLEILNGGATICTGDVNIGSLATSVGYLLIDGPGSSFSAAGNAVNIGARGTGYARLTNGASGSSGSLALGTVGGVGDLILEGAGSKWTCTGGIELALSATGRGSIVVNPGTALHTGSTLIIGSGGSLTLNGGTCAFGSIFSFGVFNFNSGTIELLNPGSLSPIVAMSGPSLPQGKNLRIATEGTLDTPLTLDGGNFVGNTLNISPTGNLALQSPSSVASFSTVTNSGLIRGNGLLTTGALTNSPGGEIRAGAGESLQVTSSTLANSGQVNLFSGELHASGNLINTASGQINGRGVLGAASIDNSGLIALSAGISDIFGDIANQSGAKIIVTGTATATFWDEIANNAGAELRVSTGSTAVFFGDVTGSGAITGSGLKIFESNGSSVGRMDTDGSTRVEAGAALVADRVREDALTIVGSVTIRPGNSDATTSRLNALEIEGGTSPLGQLDLANNDLVIDYDGDSPLPTIRAQIISGYANGAWSGNGITSSSADAVQFALGYGEASELFTSFPATFSGQLVDESSLIIRFTRYGDANLDGEVDLADFNRLASNFNTGPGNTWVDADFNYDGAVDLDDFNLLAGNFGFAALTRAPTPEDWSALASAIPEPSLLFPGMATFVAIGAARNRRRSR